MAFRLGLFPATRNAKSLFSSCASRGLSAAHNSWCGANIHQDWQEDADTAALLPLVQAAVEVATMVDSLVLNEEQSRKAAIRQAPPTLPFTVPALLNSKSEYSSQSLMPSAQLIEPYTCRPSSKINADTPLAQPRGKADSQGKEPLRGSAVSPRVPDAVECSNCGHSKPLKDFYKDNAVFCKTCLWSERAKPLDVALMKRLVTRYPQKAARHGWSADDFAATKAKKRTKRTA